MKKKIAYGLLVLMIVGAAGVASVLAYSLMSGVSPFENPTTPVESEEMYTNEDEYIPYNPNPIVYSEDGVARISPATIMQYEFYDPATSTFEMVEEMPSPIMLGMTRGEVANMFVDWRILYFTPGRVHLRQNDALEHRQFTISSHEGFVAVFYDNDQSQVKELTNRPIDALAEEEQKRLAEGIQVRGNEELIRALEDFGS